MKLFYFIPTILLFGGSMAAAHQPIDTSNSMVERDINPNSLIASFGGIDAGFSPHAHHPRSIFRKRQICDSSSDNICTRTNSIIRCCPSGYTCYYSNDDWRCDPNLLGLTRGQKIGIGIGVTVGFFLICIIGFVIFFCCCRKVIKVASGAVSAHNNNNNNQGVYPPQQPVMYGHTGQGYDPAAIPLTQVGHEGKPYVENMGYYAPPQQQGGKSDRSPISWLFCRGWKESLDLGVGERMMHAKVADKTYLGSLGYDQYGQHQYPPPAPPPPPPPPGPQNPPYQQSPPPQGGYHH
ncbi:hypothetical protein EV426DRAFT_308552 [Tirmania nivea]|nr:hypothetical protein EV426DRAFT_308552 [Tirmania nivea]